MKIIIILSIFAFSTAIKSNETNNFYNNNIFNDLNIQHYNKKRNLNYFDIIKKNKYIFKKLKNINQRKDEIN